MSAGTTYIKPQMRLFQDVEEVFSGQIGALQAVIVGPHFDVKKYVAGALDANYNLLAGTYIPGQENAFPWPNRAAGGIVDLDNVVVHIDAARAKYWDGEATAAATKLVAGTRTQIRSSSINWATYGAYPRSPLLPQRDVAIGDAVRVQVPAASVDMYSRVTGLINDPVPASIGAVAADTSNAAAAPASATGSLYSSVGTPPGMTMDGSAYAGAAAGLLKEVFTITVTADPTGGDNDTAELLVTSDAGVNVVAANTASGVLAITEMRGLEVTFDTAGAFEAGQTWTVTATSAYTEPVITLAGTYTGPQNTTYIMRVLSSGIVGSATQPPAISVDTTNGVDTERVSKTLDADDFLIGNFGIEAHVPADTGFVAGDQFTFSCVAQQMGAVSTIAIADSLPETVTTSMAVRVDLFLQKDIVITADKQGQAPYLNYTADLFGVTLSPEVTYFDPTVVDGAGNELRMIVDGGRVYLEYRGLMQTYSNAVHEMSTAAGAESTSVLDTIKATLGYYGAENPLAMGVYFASFNSGGTPVLYIAVKSDDLEGYSAAIGRLDGRTGTYGIVPLTQDPQILAYIHSQITVAASPENARPRKGWFTEKFTDQLEVITEIDGAPALAKITSRVEDNGRFITVEMTDGKFLTNGVRPGDIFRFNYRSDGFTGTTYESYTVDHVLSEDSLKLMSGPDHVYDIALKAEIWRTLTASEVAVAYASRARYYKDKRINLIWPPEAPVNGETVSGAYLCSSLAGLKASVLPHQGLTNTEVRGFDAMPLSTDYMTEADLNVMAAAGVWIVTYDPNEGVFTRHQLTTAGYDDIKRREDSVVANWDSIAYRLRNLYRQYIGSANLTPAFIQHFKTVVEWDLHAIQNETAGANVNVGPQIVTYEIVEFRQHDTLPDALICRVRFTGPTPFNNFDMYMIL